MSAGMSRRIVDVAVSLLGHLRGGLGYVAILATVMLASMSGSAVADAAALSAFLVPMMIKAGYEPARTVGLIAAGAIIAPIIPPSIPFVFFGVLAGVSITKLFLAGIVPGLLLAVVARDRLVVDDAPRGAAAPAARERAPGRPRLSSTACGRWACR